MSRRLLIPSPYNTYARTTGDPAYEADREDLQVLFRPLFWTSFMLADYADVAGDAGLTAALRAQLGSALVHEVVDPVVEHWVDVDVQHGPDALEQVWREVQSGRADPRTGHVVTP